MKQFGVELLSTSLHIDPSQILPLRVFTDGDLDLHQKAEAERQGTRKQSGTSENRLVGVGSS